MDNNGEKRTFGVVTEIGTFGDLNIKDPTIVPVEEKNGEVDIDEYVKRIKESMNQK